MLWWPLAAIAPQCTNSSSTMAEAGIGGVVRKRRRSVGSPPPPPPEEVPALIELARSGDEKAFKVELDHAMQTAVELYPDISSLLPLGMAFVAAVGNQHVGIVKILDEYPIPPTLASMFMITQRAVPGEPFTVSPQIGIYANPEVYNALTTNDIELAKILLRHQDLNNPSILVRMWSDTVRHHDFFVPWIQSPEMAQALFGNLHHLLVQPTTLLGLLHDYQQASRPSIKTLEKILLLSASTDTMQVTGWDLNIKRNMVQALIRGNSVNKLPVIITFLNSRLLTRHPSARHGIGTALLHGFMVSEWDPFPDEAAWAQLLAFLVKDVQANFPDTLNKTPLTLSPTKLKYFLLYGLDVPFVSALANAAFDAQPPSTVPAAVEKMKAILHLADVILAHLLQQGAPAGSEAKETQYIIINRLGWLLRGAAETIHNLKTKVRMQTLSIQLLALAATARIVRHAHLAAGLREHGVHEPNVLQLIGGFEYVTSNRRRPSFAY